MTQYTDPQAVADLAKLDRHLHDERMTVLACLPPNGIAETDSAIAATTGLDTPRIRQRLAELRDLGLVEGKGAWWHRKGAR